MSFYLHELERIEDVELFLSGASVQDLGYEEMSLQLRYDILELGNVIRKLQQRKKVPGQS